MLTGLARDQEVGEHGLVALDWHSGNRSVLVDHELSGVVVGQTLATRPEDIYRALLEATAFGTRVIVRGLPRRGVPVTEFIVAGGLAKNPLLMQIYADVLRLPLSVIGSARALRSARRSTRLSPLVPTPTSVGSRADGQGPPRRASEPDEARAQSYDRLFAEYLALHDHFGRDVAAMRRLRGSVVMRLRADTATSGAGSPALVGNQEVSA